MFSGINAGRQLFIFIHRDLLEQIDMNTLSSSTDQSGQTQWSGVMRAVSGILSLATVRPAPFYTALSCSLSQTEAAYV
uniref:Uncharacterized protein n=1 Tax=Salmonella enterica I TaxID=59201 RepID=F2Q8Z3_SALET|nr:hypothetical protein CTnscr_102a [Salmonella enterica subsp. enterica] [Salmonella enterica subsp. enterica serovar Senftenberg]